MFFDKVYECELYSITPNIRVNKDWGRYQSIEAAEVVPVMKIMVKKTFIKDMYKEIVTGHLIPAYRVTLNLNKAYPTFINHVPYKPVFIEFEEVLQGIHTYSKLEVAKADAVEAYLNKYLDKKDELEAYLEEKFEQAESYYEEALKLDNYSDKERIKTLLNSIPK